MSHHASSSSGSSSAHASHQPSPAMVSSFLDDVVDQRLARVAHLYQNIEPSPVDDIQTNNPYISGRNVNASRHSTKPQANKLDAPKTPMGELAQHLINQWDCHQAVHRRTNAMFNVLLTQLEDSTSELRQQLSKISLSQKGRLKPSKLADTKAMPQVFASIDGDRSVGMVNLLWHRLNFSIRSQTQPFAIIHPGNGRQLLCGRILCLRGDFMELMEDNPLHEMDDLLRHEVASLYIPASGQCFIGLGHSGLDVSELSAQLGQDADPLIPIDEDMVVEKFVEHCLMMVCTSDLLHEQLGNDPFDNDDF